jgi:hypothetical protein
MVLWLHPGRWYCWLRALNPHRASLQGLRHVQHSSASDKVRHIDMMCRTLGGQPEPGLHQNCVRAELSAVNGHILRFKYRATPVVFCEEDKSFIPLELRNRYRVSSPESSKKLLWWIHGKPEVEVPPVGSKLQHVSPYGTFTSDLHERLPSLNRWHFPLPLLCRNFELRYLKAVNCRWLV